MKTWMYRFAVAALAFGACDLQAQPASKPVDPAIFNLSGAFADEFVPLVSDLCSQRVPASRTDWSGTSRQWHEAHREKLASLEQSTRALAAALEKMPARGAPLDLEQFAMYRGQGAELFMYGLAAADDAKALELCARMRAKLLDRTLQDRLLDDAQQAVSAALAAVSKN